MIKDYAEKAGKEDVLISSDFNFAMINILWQIVAGKRITKEDTEGRKMVDLVNEIFTTGNIDIVHHQEQQPLDINYASIALIVLID